jgi:hypothetical protein
MAKNASVPMEIEPRRAFYTAKGNNLRPDFITPSTAAIGLRCFCYSYLPLLQIPTMLRNNATRKRIKSIKKTVLTAALPSFPSFLRLVDTGDLKFKTTLNFVRRKLRLHVPISTSTDSRSNYTLSYMYIVKLRSF